MENKELPPRTQSIFIDESGDLGKHGSAYFTIVALASPSGIRLSRIIKRVREKKLKKKLKELAEIKANNSNESIRRYVLEGISKCDCSVSAIAIPKAKIRDYLFDKQNKLYNYLCGLLFSYINLNFDRVEIIIDKKHSNRLLREDFNQYISTRIRQKAAGINFSIKHLESHASNELQAVDFVAWAIGRKYSLGDSSYYDIIRPKIKNAGEEEIWK